MIILIPFKLQRVGDPNNPCFPYEGDGRLDISGSLVYRRYALAVGRRVETKRDKLGKYMLNIDEPSFQRDHSAEELSVNFKVPKGLEAGFCNNSEVVFKKDKQKRVFGDIRITELSGESHVYKTIQFVDAEIEGFICGINSREDGLLKKFYIHSSE